MENHSFYTEMMQRCLQLAKNGLGTTYPNPLVGSVITHQGKIIGEGWHQKSGLPHAEIMAINQVQDKEKLPFSTIFVNLEPCSHFGKTPPCAHKIVELKIPKVVIGCRDFAAHVNGKGINYLRENGVEVVENILEKESLELNKRFFTFHQKKRPYIILKWAQTSNGFFAPNDGTQKWISNEYVQQWVHRLRTQEQAILIGKNTLLADNPALTARLWAGNQPIPIVLSSQENFNQKDFQLFKNKETILLSLNSIENDSVENSENGDQNLEKLMNILHQKSIQSVIVEGGAKTLTQFKAMGLWDEAYVITGKPAWKEGIRAPWLVNFELKKTIEISDNRLNLYANSKP